MTADGVAVKDVEAEVADIVDSELAGVSDITDRVIEGELTTF